MAISLIAVGGWATGTTSLSVAYPSGIQAGDLLVMAIANKYPTNSPATPTDWVIPTNGQQSGGSGANGIDSGNVYATIMVKIATGSESGSLTVNIASGDSAVAEMALYRKAADKSWEYVCTNGSDNTAGTDWSVTGAVNPGITAGDRMFTCSGINADSFTFSSHAISATGVTFGAVQADGSGTSLGEDCDAVLTDHVVSSGTASAAPVFTMSASGSAANSPAGATVIMRMREVTAGNNPIAGSSTGTASNTGTVAGKGLLSGIATAIGAASAVILAVGQLIGLSAGTSTATSIVTAKGYIATSANAVAAVNGQINAKGSLSGLSDGIAGVTGTMLQGAISGVVVGNSTTTGILSAKGYVASSSSGIAATTGVIRATGHMSGTSTGLSTAAGTATTGNFIIGSAAGVATSSGVIYGIGSMSGSSAGTSTAILTWQATVTNKILALVSPIKTGVTKQSVISSAILEQSRIKQLL